MRGHENTQGTRHVMPQEHAKHEARETREHVENEARRAQEHVEYVPRRARAKAHGTRDTLGTTARRTGGT